VCSAKRRTAPAPLTTATPIQTAAVTSPTAR
jgi:hypothetical protein